MITPPKKAKNALREEVENRLATDTSYRRAALCALHSRQTGYEQSQQKTRDRNNAGFSSADAKLLTALAAKVNAGQTLTPVEEDDLRRLLPKYWRQLSRVKDTSELLKGSLPVLVQGGRMSVDSVCNDTIDADFEKLESCVGAQSPAVPKPMARITRPRLPAKTVSYLRDQSGMNELVLVPEGRLRFVVRREGRFHYYGTAGEFKPPQWLEAFALGGTLLLPSGAARYGDIDALAERVRFHIHKYFDCPELFESVAVLFVLLTWIPELFNAVPYLRFLGIAGTGKSRGSDVIGSICYRRLGISGAATSAPIYHMIETVGGTLIIDEADFAHSAVGSEIAKILNCGYQRGTPVVRMEKVEDRFEPRAYEVFGPKILNGRARFGDDATESRCLTLVTRETERQDIPTQLPPEFHAEALALRNELLWFRFDYLDRLQFQNIHIEGVGRRTNQIVLPLLVIARELKDPRFESNLLEFARELDAKTRQERGETVDAALVTAYLEAKAAGKPPTCGDVLSHMTPGDGPPDPELKGLCARKISSLAKTLGFETKKTNVGAKLLIEPKQLQTLCERFSIVTPSSPEPSLCGDATEAKVTEAGTSSLGLTQ